MPKMKNENKTKKQLINKPVEQRQEIAYPKTPGTVRGDAEDRKDRLLKAISIVNDGIAMTDEMDRFVYVNASHARIYGYAQDELIGKTWRDLISAELIPLVDKDLAKTLHNIDVGIWSGESPALRKDGTMIHTGITATSQWDEKGNYLGHICIVRDISERKQSEEVLQESENRYRTLAEAANDIIFIIDSDDRVRYLNRSGAQFLGREPEDVVGKPRAGFFPPDISARMKSGLQTVFETGEPLYAEDETPSSQGIIYLGTNLVPLRDETGKVYAVLGISRDVTVRKRFEEELKNAYEFLENVMQSTTNAICVIDLEGQIILVNQRCLQMTGCTGDELVGKPFSAFFPQELLSHTQELFKSIVTDGKIVSEQELEITRKDGKRIILSVSGVPLYRQGKITSLVGTAEDITERKRLEEQLRHAQKMEALGTLTGGISHEFNNILQAIIGYGEILENALDKDNPLRTHADAILSSAQRAADLIKGLLAYSRKQVIQQKLFSLNEIMKRVEGLLSRFIGEDIDLRIMLTDDDLLVNVDSNQIEQALMNLVTNAKDAMPDGGTLTIRTDSVVIDDEFINTHGYGDKGIYALISVRDTGIGMDERTRDNIFEPFFTTKGVGKGTGLGLSTVYGIVKGHNGYIDVSSVPGGGTTFNIYIPAIRANIEEEESRAEPPVRGGTETILVAEDDAEVRNLISTLLKKSGYEVIETVDGEDAIEKLRENEGRIQLLICDVVMPKKDGKEVYYEMMNINAGIKALFISGYTDDIIREKGILAEGLAFVSKPILPRELLRSIRDVLDK